jgi:hypothetical protein|tara:strand:- start:1369 stop:2175 length:807 start_codon:yes stop_codon:yes gene_type:complete
MINTKILRPINWENLIRLGRDNDGGYVIPYEIIFKTNVLLSYGTNKDWSFEKCFIKKNSKVDIHCYDHTLNLFSLIRYTITSILLVPLYCITFDRKRLKKCIHGIFILPDYYVFFRKKVKHFKYRIWNTNVDYSKTINYTLSQIPKTARKNIFIKMDIEGTEYKVLNDIIDLSDFIGAIVVEFHAIDKYEEDFNKIINKISKYFNIVHVHGNNYSKLLTNQNFPSTIEITFLNKSHCDKNVKLSVKKYPLEGLDQPNKISRPDYDIVF